MRVPERFAVHGTVIVLWVLGALAFVTGMAGQTAPSKNDHAPVLPGISSADGSAAQAYTVLYNFCSQAKCADGDQPFGGLVEDASGDLYGTTSLGGSSAGVCFPFGCGVVFKLDSAGNYTVMHNFCSEANCADGEIAYAGMIQDDSGNLYGTTIYGGAHHIDPNANGGGTIFKVDSAGNYTVLYSFCSQANCADGYLPYTGVTADASGNLYGVTVFGGAYGVGTAFKVDSKGNYTILHSFCAQANCADGSHPEAGLIVDTSGNLYGTTTTGGAYSGGTAFKLDSKGNYTILHSFCAQANCADGYGPLTSLIEDAAGNLYGTTSGGGGEVNGAVPIRARYSSWMAPAPSACCTFSAHNPTVRMAGRLEA